MRPRQQTSVAGSPILTDTAGKLGDDLIHGINSTGQRFASIPAFTEFGSQRVTYFAVDNKTGVKSFDVRWRRGPVP